MAKTCPDADPDADSMPGIRKTSSREACTAGRKKRVRIPEKSGTAARARMSLAISWHELCNWFARKTQSGKGDSPMAETPNERMQDAADLAAAARDRGIEQLEGAKGQLAEGAERVAAAVERTANELEGDGDDAISGFGRSDVGRAHV